MPNKQLDLSRFLLRIEVEMAKPRKQRSPQELRRASMAVQYEVSMIGSTLSILLESQVSHSSSAHDRIFSNAILHSFLLAARNLVHFLFSHKPHANDVIAENFFDDPGTWRQMPACTPPGFADGELVSHISKRLMHLTWDRASKTKLTWGAFPIAFGIAEALDRFVSHVEASRIDERLVVDVRLLLQGLQKIRNRDGGLMGPLGTILPHDDFDLGLP